MSKVHSSIEEIIRRFHKANFKSKTCVKREGFHIKFIYCVLDLAFMQNFNSNRRSLLNYKIILTKFKTYWGENQSVFRFMKSAG